MIKLLLKVFRKLKKKNISVSTAESCTGGLLSSSITSLGGSSKIFKYGLITYSNEAKIKLLKVPGLVIKKHGAVSYETCLSMLKNLYKLTKSKICISITGIAGPKGGSKSKPVGLVFVGVKYNKKTLVKKFLFKSKKRISIQKMTVASVFKIILTLIK